MVGEVKRRMNKAQHGNLTAEFSDITKAKQIIVKLD